MATDYLAVGIGFTFICGFSFTILGIENDTWWRAAFYEMFATIAWYATAFLFWGSGSAWVSIPWLFVGLAFITFILVIFDGLMALNVYKRSRRGY